MTEFSYDHETELLVEKNTQAAVDFRDAYQIYESISERGYLKKLDDYVVDEIFIEIIRTLKNRPSKDVTFEFNPMLLEFISIHKDEFIRVNEKLKSLPPEPIYIY